MNFLTTVELFIRETRQPLPGIKVALYDRDRRSQDDLLGEVVTDRDGKAQFDFSTQDFVDRFGLFDDTAFTFPYFNLDNLPDLYVVIYNLQNEPIMSTRRRARENSVPITLPVSISRNLAIKHHLIDPTKWSHVSNWFTDRCNLPHTASINMPLTLPLTKRWQVQPGGAIIASATGGHGHVYIGNSDQNLYALNPNDGSIEWTAALGSKVSSTATALEIEKDGSGRVFVTAEDGVLYALNSSDGSQIWSVPGGTGSFISSTNTARGHVYYTYMFSGVSSQLRAVSTQNGAIIWETEPFNITTATPMHGFGAVFLGIAQSGQVYKRFDDGTGNPIWAYSDNHFQAENYTSGILDADVEMNEPVRVYVSTRRGLVRALNAINGTQIWETELPTIDRIYGFALTQNRTENVLIVSQLKNLFALDPKTGAIKWHLSYATNSVSSVNRKTPQPAIWGDFVIHVTGGNKLVAINLATGIEQWHYDLNGQTYSSPMIAGETVYIGTNSGIMYAFSPGECVDFQAYPDNTQLGQSFHIGGLSFTGLGSVASLFVNDVSSNVRGLQFDPDGIQIDLPETSSEVSLQVGSYTNQSLNILALDSNEDVVDQQSVLGDNKIHTIHLTGQSIKSVVITGGGYEGVLVDICIKE